MPGGQALQLSKLPHRTALRQVRWLGQGQLICRVLLLHQLTRHQALRAHR